MPNLQLQAKAQALYMEYILNKAKQQVEAQITPAFDPQGRVLTTIILTDADYALIADSINKGPPEQHFTGDIEGIIEALGKKPTVATTVSLDHIEQAQFDKVVTSALNSIGVTNSEKQLDLIVRYHQLPKGSVIPLQQEFDFHLGLVSRVYQQKAPNNVKEIIEAKEATMLEVNKLVMKEFAKALEKAGKEPGPLNSIELNIALDKARKKITSQSHEIFVRELAKRGVNKEDLQAGKESFEKLAEKTTATANDMLHVDNAVGLITLIEGTDNTAHHRVPEAKNLAKRQIVTHHLDDGVVKPNPHPRIQIRTPSLDVKKIKKSFDIGDAVVDVAKKLDGVRKDYDLDHTVTGDARKPRAFIYNLHTALNDTLDEMMGSNKQSQGAEIILLGAHLYNEVSAKKDPPVFCFVQNISVNGRGDTLSHDATDPLLKEASLMSDLALLHTLYDAADETEKEKIGQVFNQYKKYLEEKPRPHFFSESQHAGASYKLIEEIKTTWAQSLPPPAQMDMNGMAQRGLQRLFAANLHQTHEYAKLAQALSVFCEEASISGCKSGNERAQAINGRVAILDAVSQGKLGPEGDELLKSLSALSSASNPAEIKRVAGQLNNAMNVTYNEHGLQLAATMISLADQGAAAKVEASTGYWLLDTFNSNLAEENFEVMSNLQQSKAGKMQAHKGLFEEMQSAIDKVHGPTARERISDWMFAGFEGKRKYTIVAPIVSFVVGLALSPLLALWSVAESYFKGKTVAESREKHLQQVGKIPLERPENIPVVKSADESPVDKPGLDHKLDHGNDLSQPLHEKPTFQRKYSESEPRVLKPAPVLVDPSVTLMSKDAIAEVRQSVIAAEAVKVIDDYSNSAEIPPDNQLN